MEKPSASAVTPEARRSAGLDAIALATAAAILSAAVMLLLGIFGRVGIYLGAVEMMERWHLFFRPTFGGTLSGMVEAAVVSFVLAWLFGWLYNRLARRLVSSRHNHQVEREGGGPLGPLRSTDPTRRKAVDDHPFRELRHFKEKLEAPETDHS